MKKGFTLAEVLITLGVVGIVAVLTVPAVMKNYRNRMYVAQLQKVSAQLSDAAQAIMNDEHVDNFYETKAANPNSCSDASKGACEKGPGYLLNNYMKPLKRNCIDGSDPCASSTGSVYTNMQGQALNFGFGGYCIYTTNGATVCASYNVNNNCMSVAVDVNGMVEPNMAGRDIFAMDIHKDGTLSDWGSGCADNSFGCDKSLCGTGRGKDSVSQASCGCYSRLIKSDWNMDY